MDLSLRRSAVGAQQVLSVSGDIDVATLPRFADSITRLLSDAMGSIVVVDLDGAQSLDDAALGLLLGAAGKARAAGGDVVVVCTEPRLRERLMITGFDKAIIVRHSIVAP